MIINEVEYLDPYKENKTDQIYWLTPKDNSKGEHLFSFDLKKVYNLFEDYPWALSKAEKEIFDNENPFWAEFFEDR